MSYELTPQPAKKSSCLGNIVKFFLIVFGLFVALIVIVAIIPSSKPATTTTAPAQAGKVTVAPVLVATDTPAPIPTATLTTKQMQDTAETLSFRELARNTEQYKGKLLKYEGKVIQVMEDSGDYQLRVNVTKDDYNNWSDTIFLICPQCPTRPLEDDIVSFVAVVDGRLTYKSVLGGEITLPQLTARVFDVTTK